jgi:hypothetical protein
MRHALATEVAKDDACKTTVATGEEQAVLSEAHSAGRRDAVDDEPQTDAGGRVRGTGPALAGGHPTGPSGRRTGFPVRSAAPCAY